jgi:hypothetical protein
VCLVKKIRKRKNPASIPVKMLGIEPKKPHETKTNNVPKKDKNMLFLFTKIYVNTRARIMAISILKLKGIPGILKKGLKN